MNFLFREHLGAALRAARETADVRPAEVAALVGRDQSTVWRWESGKNWPEDPDRVVLVYSDLTGRTQRELWDDAIRRADEEDAASAKRAVEESAPPD